MAPAKKRKAPKAPNTPAKKVRIGITTSIPDTAAVSPSGRPQRATVSEQNYKDTKTNLRRAQIPSPPVADPETAPKKRGRPPKVATPPVPGRGRPRKPLASPPPEPEVEKKVTTAKGRGRPRKNPEGAPAQSTVKSTRASINAKARTQASAPAKRGRKPKVSVEATQVDDATDSEDPLSVSNGRHKLEDISSLDPDTQYWLMKAEPETRIEKGRDVRFSIDDLAARTEPEAWDGVRNAVARNNMRGMRKGDLAFFYHSNCTVPGVVGVMRIVAEHSVDESAFDPEHPYFDAKSDRSKPKWEVVHVENVKKFENMVSLKELKSFSKPGGALEAMQTLKQTRLSVSSVSPKEWAFVLDLAGESITVGQEDGMDGYESEVDGEGEETTGLSDADGINGLSDEDVGLGISGSGGEEGPVATEEITEVTSDLID